MRNILIAGAAGLLFTMGAVGVANATQPNPNVASWSPYAIGAYGGPPQSMAHRSTHRMMNEGRAAYVKPAMPDQIFSDGSSDENYTLNPDSLHNPGNTPSGPKNEEPMADQ
jgi:hypothetical protein